MTQDRPSNPNQPTEPVRRSPLDALWFTILFASIAVGIGLTIFAPVGDEPRTAAPVPATTAPAITATTTSMTTQPATLPTP
jgi:hypothetical protein